jgi:Xaa-Pro aminopeptidase
MINNREAYAVPKAGNDIAVLPVAERNRRHGAVRAGLRTAELAGIIVTGSHLTYLTNGIWGEQFGVLTTDENEEFELVLPWRYLVDLDAKVVTDSQEWVKRVSSGRDPTPLAARIKEVGLEAARVGFAGEISQQTHAFLMKAMPGLQLVDASAILNNVRTIKSELEIALIDRANEVFTAAVLAICERVRPGMPGRRAVEIGRQAMWDAGGDLDSGLTFNFGADPAQNPLLANILLNDPIKAGDIATLTAHAHYHHYAGHSDQEIVFGDPKPRHLKMFEAVKSVRDAVLKTVRDGTTNRELYNVYESACASVGYLSSEHAQMHQYGIDVPEFPGPAFRVKEAGGKPAGKPLSGGGNYTLKTGMILSISPTLCDEASGDLLLGGTSLAVTADGFRELGARPVEMLVAG